MDLNLEYAAHQRAIMGAQSAANDDFRAEKLEQASQIAGRISVFQQRLGVGAACAWSKAEFAKPIAMSAKMPKPIL